MDPIMDPIMVHFRGPKWGPKRGHKWGPKRGHKWVNNEVNNEVTSGSLYRSFPVLRIPGKR